MMGNDLQKPHQLKKFKHWMVISFVITILFLIFLIWLYKPDVTLQFSVHYHSPTDAPQNKEQSPPPQQCGQRPNGQKVSLMAVNETKTVLVSAYQEHRKGKKEVRVIAVVLRNENVAYRCLLCCLDKLLISEGVSNSTIHRDHFYFAYGTADIMCPLPSGCETTSHISLISSAAKAEGTEELHMSEKTCNSFLEVKNQKAKSDSFSYNFTVCVSTMFDFTNVLQLVQSLEVLQLLDVDRVVIYKTSCSKETQLVLDYYTEKGLVEVIPWSWSRFLKVSRGFMPSRDPGDLHYYGQIPALNDCVYRYMYKSRYVALHDIDELILPQSVKSWSELLPILEGKYGADKCYMFENNVFPTTITKTPPAPHTLPTQSPDWQNVSGVNILAHLYQEPIIKKTKYMQFKIIVNPRAVFSMSIHGLLESQKGCSWVNRNIARMYHTRAPRQPNLTPEQLIYNDRLLSYSDRLTPAVTTVLRESGLLSEDNSH
ncbi:Beta-1,4-galactosyltransferase galt-1 [Channa argus]|uniref:Glycosyltransferase family 92 protein n=1 Tax=Channa argus TaxID=215402 RepID=A0A6G1PT18_CHAAH|nr:Beta-1,4-galactosyltransferase galt-1 [Channa argus]